MINLRMRWLLAALWLGGLAGVGLIGAPVAFATVPEKMLAAAVASKGFYLMAIAAIVLGVAITVLERWRGPAARMDADQLLPLAGVFFAVFGEFGVVPHLLQAAVTHSPQAGLWHGLASLVYALQALCVAAYVWRLPGRGN
ncbi:MAG: DUF4149 domain-containing protein [Thiomonas sp.]|jgi:hypothetical protein